MTSFKVLWLAASLAVVVSSAHAQTQVATPDPATPQWKVLCDKGGRCTALLALTDTISHRLVGSIGLQIGKGGTEPAMIALLPLGVEIKPGFRAVISGQGFTAPFVVCLSDGCRASALLPPDALETWLAGDTLSFQFFPYGSAKPVSADAPITGLREALKDQLAP